MLQVCYCGHPVCLARVSVSAYRADDEDRSASRAAIVRLIEPRYGIPADSMCAIDNYSRKLPRVTRSAFGAELAPQLEVSELDMMRRGVWHRIYYGVPWR